MRRALSILSTASAVLATTALILLLASLIQPLRCGPLDITNDGYIWYEWASAGTFGQPTETHWEVWGIAYWTATYQVEGYQKGEFILYLYWPLALFSALPAVQGVRWYWRWRRRLVPGLCPNCGYDLRATPDRCPECGTVPATDPTGSSATR